ncbi:D-alanyl-D-alanine carboxypeptidase/D-alanyl-D-alanine-endopeptidase (penicillin-binding protein 4) [Silvimonas terrae]|uniref:D-alanyl-D-alanine carboxypeptidase/D-alanyl-D-alanine-endopeptidase (Penicillin-binding protein 4) n=1 Tax=Silvimonas terrae TaxID=300266 RepID=A0A840RK18_9NEIS|nr:D-alanyl-D-alanine carboxypeptidase/D-alanyl-D-alanine-endopeptidase [Silvimonas terrae]MBB5192501.1 D-alanyl-D-alanine carboxypeptidase/D-alanyl-D-alanine-endopeptidase (penicillin-binding protein 4) [Silvimonas terrae]
MKLSRLCSTRMLSALGLALTVSVATAANPLPAPVAAALNNAHLPASALSLVVLPLDQAGGEYWNADVPANPASTMKLITTFAALDLLGPAFSWNTDIYSDGVVSDGVLRGNLYLKGSGDPKFTMERLWMLLRDVRAAGIKRINGDIVLDRSYLSIPAKTSFADDGNDPARAYLVGPDSLLVNFHAFRFHVVNDAGGARVNVDPPLPELTVDSAIKTSAAAPCAGSNLAFMASGAGSAVRVKVTGALPADCAVDKYQSYLDAVTYTGSLARYLWQQTGGEITGGIRTGEVPTQATRLAQSQSSDLASNIRDINKYSNNLMARQLFLTLGARYRQPGEDDIQSAARTIQTWLQRRGGNWPELVLENGSGLSREEQISARHMAQLLQWAGQSPYAPEFISSLPIAAVDGTMKKRLKDSDVAGEAHIKTGTLKNVRAAAGFVRADDGRMRVVVAILNHPQAERGLPVLDAVLAWVQQSGAVALAGNAVTR